MKAHYSLLIQWSAEDHSYLVTIPEFVDQVAMPCTHGATYEEAGKRGQEVIETFLAIWQAKGQAAPEPNLFGLEPELVEESLQVA